MLFRSEREDGIVLSSYEIPEGEDKSTFSYGSMKNVDYTELKKSEKLEFDGTVIL